MSSPVQSSLSQIGKVDHSSKMHILLLLKAKYVCNTDSRILQQSEKFIFFGMNSSPWPAPGPYACGVWTYKLPLLQRRKQFTQDSNRIGHKVGPRLLVRLGSHFYIFFI